MSRVVRSSKFRHVFGTVVKKEECFDELRITKTAWDSNYIAASPTFFAVMYQSSGGGSFGVIPFANPGKISANYPAVTGHKGEVLDLAFNPFNDNLVASASDDCTIKIWGIPEGGLQETMTEPLQTLNGHRRKVGTVLFNPIANNVLASSSTDYGVKVWDIEKGANTLSIEGKHTDIIQSIDWTPTGAHIVSISKDKKVRLMDPRKNGLVAEVEGHGGIKGSRAIWLSDTRVLTCGFSKTSEREFLLWDSREFTKPLTKTMVDSASGLLMPFFDNDTSMLYLIGKGDGNIRYYEVVDEAPYIHYLSEFKSNTPQRGCCLMPKRAVKVSDCEVARILKVGVKLVEPISFQVPRKTTDLFQDDLFPDCFSGEPTISGDEWLSGKNGEPKRRSMAPGFVKKEVKQDFNPTKQQEEKPLSESQMKDLIEKLTKRNAFLEAELVKRDAKIKELESS